MPSQLEPPPVSESRNRRGSGRSYTKGATLPTQTVEELEADPDLAGGTKWLVHDLIASEALTVLYGIGKSGKTTFLSHLAAAVIGATPFLDRDVTGGPVLWIDLEQHKSLTRDVLAAAGASQRKHRVHVYNGPAPSIESIETTVRELGAVLVVVDSLSKLLLLRDENDASEVTRAIDPLLELRRKTGAAVVAIHHERKREGAGGRSMRGSSAFLAALDVGISVKVNEADQKRTLEFIARYPSVNGMSLSVRLTETGYELLGDRQTARLEDIVRAIGQDSLTAEEIGQRLGVKRQAVLSRLTSAYQEGGLKRTGGGKKGDPHRFAVANAVRQSDPIGAAELQKAS